MKKIPEKKIKEEVKKILKKYNVAYFMPVGGLYGTSGITDFVCCVNGYYVGIETKSSDKGESGLTQLQSKHCQDVLKSNGSWLLVYNESTLASLEKFLLLTLAHDE